MKIGESRRLCGVAARELLKRIYEAHYGWTKIYITEVLFWNLGRRDLSERYPRAAGSDHASKEVIGCELCRVRYIHFFFLIKSPVKIGNCQTIFYGDFLRLCSGVL